MAAWSTSDTGQQYIEPTSTSASAQAAMLPILIHVYRRGGYAAGTDEFGDRIEISDSRRDFVWTELALKFGTLVNYHPSGQYVLTKWITLGTFHHPSGQ